VPRTIFAYVRDVRQMLVTQLGSEANPECLRASDIEAIVTDVASRHSVARTKGIVRALRAFIRWLELTGIVGEDLRNAVPRVVNRDTHSTPSTLTGNDVRTLLRGCDRRTAKGRRDHAVLMLLSRLGLRAGEVVGLQLEDVNWRTGELTVHRKGDWQDRLPLPPDVGQSLAGYLSRGRPRCDERTLFLCLNAPYRRLGNSSTVSSIVASAMARVGLKPARRGAHILRHTLATDLLRHGATYTEIGNLLGHRTTAATEIYAKVDFSALSSVAQEWPGACS